MAASVAGMVAGLLLRDSSPRLPFFGSLQTSKLACGKRDFSSEDDLAFARSPLFHFPASSDGYGCLPAAGSSLLEQQ